MKLFHGSRNKYKVLKKQQAARATEDVAEDEVLEAVYLSPDRGFAVANGAKPKGLTKISHSKKTIEFEDPTLFDPDMNIYLYEVETDDVPGAELREIDDYQYALLGIDEVTPSSVEEMKAAEVQKYYELANWPPDEGGEVNRELRRGLR